MRVEFDRRSIILTFRNGIQEVVVKQARGWPTSNRRSWPELAGRCQMIAGSRVGVQRTLIALRSLIGGCQGWTDRDPRVSLERTADSTPRRIMLETEG